MILLVLISGNPDHLIQKHFLNNEVKIIKVDEKDFYDFTALIKRFKQSKSNKIFYGCLDIKYQRFTFFMHLFNLLAGLKKGAIVDEKGNSIEIRTLKTIIYHSPMFILELSIGLIVVIRYYISLLFNKWLIKE